MTMNQRLTADIRNGKVKYLHVSVQVGEDAAGRLLRTPIGKGANARKVKQPPSMPIGRQRRAQQRLMRVANEEVARASKRSRFAIT